MPFFGNKFSPKKTPGRKNNNISNDNIEELFRENHSVALKLGPQVFTFDKGEWIPDNGSKGALIKNSQKLRNRIQDLQEENNLLKLKYNLILNMITQITAENQLQLNDINKIN